MDSMDSMDSIEWVEPEPEPEPVRTIHIPRVSKKDADELKYRVGSGIKEIYSLKNTKYTISPTLLIIDPMYAWQKRKLGGTGYLDSEVNFIVTFWVNRHITIKVFNPLGVSELVLNQRLDKLKRVIRKYNVESGF